jgi:hypothetical protein
MSKFADPSFALLVARARKQAPKPKRAGRNLQRSPLFVSAKRRGGKRIAGLKRRKPALRKEGAPPFFSKANAFFPRAGDPLTQRKRSRLAEPAKKIYEKFITED